MSTRLVRWRLIATAVAALCLGSVLSGAVSARQIWNGGRNVNPKTHSCALEKATANHAFLAWDTCMGGQIKPPAMGGNATVYYMIRRKKCAPKYTLFTKARNSYKACEARLQRYRH